jgi:hypothetical protein
MKSFTKGDTIQIWDWMKAGGDRLDVLSEHGQVGIIIGESRRKDCYLVAVPSFGLVNIHQEWLRTPKIKILQQ